MPRLSKTKELIFDTAVRLFSFRDYESVNMREIAAQCDIKAASIYNHYAGKQQILDDIYAYYTKHFADNRRPEEEVKQIIHSGTKQEIFSALTFTFESTNTDKYQRMVLISKIIYMRIFDDETAKNIFLNLMTVKQEAYVKNLMDYGLEIGRFMPFDTKTFASIFVGYRHIMGMKAFALPRYEVSQLEEEQRIDKFFTELLNFTSCK